MEEKTNLPKGFFDLSKWLVDKEIADPFQREHHIEEIYQYPYEDSRSKGVIRYLIRGKRLIVLNYLVEELK